MSHFEKETKEKLTFTMKEVINAEVSPDIWEIKILANFIELGVEI